MNTYLLTCGVCKSRQRPGLDIVLHKFQNFWGPAPSGNIGRQRTRYQSNQRINTGQFDDCRIKYSIPRCSRVEIGRYLLNVFNKCGYLCVYIIFVRLVVKVVIIKIFVFIFRVWELISNFWRPNVFAPWILKFFEGAVQEISRKIGTHRNWIKKLPAILSIKLLTRNLWSRIFKINSQRWEMIWNLLIFGIR